MSDIKNKIEPTPQESTGPTAADAPATRSARLWAWLSIILAVLSWVLLMTTNGYVALGTGVAAIVAGFIAVARNKRNLRRLAITATIAATVLVVVLASLLIVIKIGLGA